MTLSPTLLAELHKLDDEQIADLLGEILDPSVHCPFDASEGLLDAMAPISAAYRAAYPLWSEPDPDAGIGNAADRAYDERRSAE